MPLAIPLYNICPIRTTVYPGRMKAVRSSRHVVDCGSGACPWYRYFDWIIQITTSGSKSLELKKEEFNLNDVIVNVTNDMKLGRGFLNNENITLFYKPRDILVRADKDRITQVVSNLLDNAVKSLKKGDAS